MFALFNHVMKSVPVTQTVNWVTCDLKEQNGSLDDGLEVSIDGVDIPLF